MERAKVIKFAKIGFAIAGSFLLFRWGRKQWKLRKLKKEFGNYSTIVNNDKGNVGGYKGDDTGSFNARAWAEMLRDAMKGWGTDEDLIWIALDNKSKDQLQLIRNYFNRHFGEGNTLFEWFEGDLSGNDLQRAKAYFM